MCNATVQRISVSVRTEPEIATAIVSSATERVPLLLSHMVKLQEKITAAYFPMFQPYVRQLISCPCCNSHFFTQEECLKAIRINGWIRCNKSHRYICAWILFPEGLVQKPVLPTCKLDSAALTPAWRIEECDICVLDDASGSSTQLCHQLKIPPSFSLEAFSAKAQLMSGLHGCLFVTGIYYKCIP